MEKGAENVREQCNVFDAHMSSGGNCNQCSSETATFGTISLTI